MGINLYTSSHIALRVAASNELTRTFICQHTVYILSELLMADDIQGPLGFWTYPVLNALVKMNKSSSESTTETAKVIRDSNGEVQEVVVINQ